MAENPSSQSRCLIVVVVAGTNEPSNSNMLADKFIEGIKEVPGVTFEKIRLKELSIDHFTLERYEESCQMEPDYLRIKTLMQESSGIVFASPVWNFSVPAHLKNLIDRMGAFALDKQTHSKGQFKGKPFGIILTGGAPMIAWKALMYLTTLHLPEAIKYYAGTVIFRHFEPKTVPTPGKFGLVVDKRPNTLAFMKKSGKKFAQATQYYATSGKLPMRHQLVHRWFTFLYRVGNRIMYPINALQ